MKSWSKSILVASAVFFGLGAFPTEEASAQGPIIRKMRERLNNGKALLPFVEGMESASRDAAKREAERRAEASARNRLTPATKTPARASKTPTRASGSGTKAPTPASGSGTKAPTPARQQPTPASKAEQKPTIKLQSPGTNPQAIASKGFGMELQAQGDDFFIGRIDPRGNAAEAGLRRGDLIEEIGGAPIQVMEEFDAIAKAMRGGDRVEFKVSRRGSKAEKVVVQFGEPAPVEESNEEALNKIDILPRDFDSSATPTRRRLSDRYEPVGNGLNSIYDGQAKPSSILEPTPAPKRANRVESLSELDFPALELNGGK